MHNVPLMHNDPFRVSYWWRSSCNLNNHMKNKRLFDGTPYFEIYLPSGHKTT